MRGGSTRAKTLEDYTTRFHDDLLATLGHAPAGPVALAVSGGPDSMAMLALAHRAFPGVVIAATVDHRLRAENAAEAATVAAWCAGEGIAHTNLCVEGTYEPGGNLQSWARQERYNLLRRWATSAGAECLCTAHHADDQAETFLMRAARGSGLSGLSAIRARTEVQVGLPGGGWTPRADGGVPLSMRVAPLVLLRPLLGWRRKELREIASEWSLPYADDPSNADTRFDRTRFRALLTSAPWIDPVGIGRSAMYLAEVDADLFALSHWLWRERALPCSASEEKLDVGGLPREVRRRLARIAIGAVRDSNGIRGPHFDGATNIEAMLDALEAGGKATQAGVLASTSGEVWRFREAPARRG